MAMTTPITGRGSAPAHSSAANMATTTIFIANLHCPSCVENIDNIFQYIQPRPTLKSTSIVSHSITCEHDPSLSPSQLSQALEAAGFEVHSIFEIDPDSSEAVEVSFPNQKSLDWEDSLEHAVADWSRSKQPLRGTDMSHRLKHVANCAECRREIEANGDVEMLARANNSRLTIDSDTPFARQGQNDFYPNGGDTKLLRSSTRHQDVKEGMMESDTDSDITVVREKAVTDIWKATITINGMTCSSCVATVTSAADSLPWVRSIDVSLLTNSAMAVIEGKQKACELAQAIEERGFDVKIEQLEPMNRSHSNSDHWQATYAIGGMTCSSCVSAITESLQRVAWIEKVDVSLIANSATVTVDSKDRTDEVKDMIEDLGYDATLDNVKQASALLEDTTQRTVSIRVEGMFCHHCPPRIQAALNKTYGKALEIEKLCTIQDPVLRLRYYARAESLTIRHIVATIASLEGTFKPIIYHPPSLEDRAREMHARERQRIVLRLALCILDAIPTFIIGIVYMSLVSEQDRVRMFLMQPNWAAGISRADWALFIMATPVYFFAADTFHLRAFKEIRALWRPGSPVPLLSRFTRFGSMNMLMSLGTTIAYFASVAELIIASVKGVSMGDSYFDSVVFLTMFLLIGRYLEAYSKARTGDAVTSLGNLRPKEAILIEHGQDQKIPTDLLEVGDTVRVQHGASPPFDGDIVDGTSKFDESSLTGESRLVPKSPGDAVFSGTVNKGNPVQIRLTSISGTSMLDQIIKVVREGQARRAPVEKVADMITAHFVPAVTAIALLTWLVWLALGLSGVLPLDWLKGTETGGWALWSLRFAIAVFVVACPCGIGLAAPTALFVGGGLAAKYGILVKGGGEAFQQASNLDCIVLDKTGTITEGGEPKVTDSHIVPNAEHDDKLILAVAQKLEESSGHPLATAIVSFCSTHADLPALTVLDAEEVPGKGMRGTLQLGSSPNVNTRPLHALIGNESLLSQYTIPLTTPQQDQLMRWKRLGCSVAVLAIAPSAGQPYTVTAMFGISDAIRPEARHTIRSLQGKGISIYLLSGDNPTTANAVGAAVGIPPSNIIAGVLPDQKAEKIRYLQLSLSREVVRGSHLFGTRRKESRRAIVAMVGDGINDAPALSTSDVGIAIGSGSDIALSSASVILLTSNLTSLLTLLSLSRTVFRRVWFNFGWAWVYNCVCIPVAAGVLYPIRTADGGHIRLDPVWASLAMALSSVSVVCSSLALRSGVPWLGFRAAESVGQHNREVKEDS